jgi:competence protein ComEC
MPGFSDRWIVALAGATAFGAWIGIVAARRLAEQADPAPLAGGLLPVGVALLAAAVALALRRPVLLCLALAVLAATLAHRSLDGLQPPGVGAVRTEVTLLGDPAPSDGGGVRVDVRLHGKRLAASAQRAAAAALDDRLAGERVLVVGTVARPGPYERRVLHRHLAGRLRVDVVSGWRAGDGVSRLANDLRRTLDRGAGSLPPRPKALLMGLVLGDDRGQPADLTDAFQAAGLSHILAVSGQTVAFVMLLVRPALVRLRFAPRLVAGVVVLAGFALLTRFEPSVLRATAMAGIGALGAAVGRPSSGLRRLGLAATGLLLVDPLLVTSVGFRLSVAGAAGIIAGAGPIERILPGPRWLAVPLGVTGAAQLAVAPLLVQAFGPVTLVSLPANLLAVPAAGPVMMWGLTAGVAAGVLGGTAAALLHLPSRLLLAWIEGVAVTAADHPLGLLHAPHVVGLLAAVGLARLATHVRPTAGGFAAPARLRRAAGAIVASVVVTSVVGARAPSGVPTGPTAVGPGGVLWRGEGVAVVAIDGRATGDGLMSGLRSAGVGRVDVLVVRTTADRAVAVAALARRRWPAAVVLSEKS